MPSEIHEQHTQQAAHFGEGDMILMQTVIINKYTQGGYTFVNNVF